MATIIVPSRCDFCKDDPREFAPIKVLKKVRDLVGFTSGLLRAEHLVGVLHGMVYWCCSCSCGSRAIVQSRNLTIKKTKSCGCATNVLKQAGSVRHGFSHTPTYRAWADMLNRCSNPHLRNYKNYGGRGITVCERWQGSFENFLTDMGERPGPAYSIERVRNNEGYSPENCTWATREEQLNNKRTNHVLTFQGESLTITQWARKLGMGVMTIQSRLKRGATVEEALSKPVGPYKHRGEDECP